MRRSLRPRLLRAVAPLALLVVGCGNGPPSFEPLLDQEAIVEQEFTLQLRANDPDGDDVTFTYAVADIEDLYTRASIQPVRKGEALFRWTPIISDSGLHTFDFTADDGKHKTTQTITIEVKISEGGGTGPTFRKPVGTGTTLDLTQKDCGTLDVVVEDPDSAEVNITQDEPIIAGANLSQDTGLTAKWSWCPTAEQIAASDRYMLRLSASDTSTTVTKDYLIVLRKPQKTDCPGEAPVIVADASYNNPEETTLLPLAFFAEVTDDKGIKNEPLLYYSVTDPGATPDVGQMTQVAMFLLDGDMKSGVWGVEVPNPVVGLQPGARADVWYVIAATDNDDEQGDCDHLTQAPVSGAFKQTVIRPTDEAGRGLCEACSADVQCGGATDNCLSIGTSGESYCSKSCAEDSDCGSSLYYCSQVEWTSVDGAKARQCIPSTYKCPPDPACQDDSYEPNDSQPQAQAMTPITAGTLSGLVLCGAGTTMDEDWFHLKVTADTQVTAGITSSAAGADLDLALQNTAGGLVALSETLTSNESVTACVKSGDYFLRVVGSGATSAPYTLVYSSQAKSCPTCSDDSSEPDDSSTQARTVSLATRYYSDTNAICPSDDDWFKVTLAAGQKLYATVEFTQTTAKEDLDIRFYQQSGANLVDVTRCTETDPSGCSTANGQSSTSNENFTYTATAAGTFYVVVHGWEGSENLYDICIATTNVAGTGCPPLAK